MARIRWHGTLYSAKPIEKLANGDWLMEAREHGARFTVGTKIQVKAADIESMDEVATPAPEQSAAALDKAMAAERKELPSVADLLAKAKPATETPA